MIATEQKAEAGLDLRLSDEEVIARVLAGEIELYEIIMRRYNQRMFRITRSVLRNDDEAEQAMQDAYVSAYLHLHQFAQQARFSTWLAKITLHEALARLRRRKRFVDLDTLTEMPGKYEMITTKEGSPEQKVFDRELRSVLESAVDALPELYRTVFVLREIEGLDTADTAACLGISLETAKVRLHRARALLRRELYTRSGAVVQEAFQFHLSRCDRVVEGTLRRIREAIAESSAPRVS